jgi:hypothetical protein
MESMINRRNVKKSLPDFPLALIHKYLNGNDLRENNAPKNHSNGFTPTERSKRQRGGPSPNRDAAPCFSVLRRSGSDSGSQTCVTERQCGLFELRSSFPHFPAVTTVVRVSISPFLSFVSDSLEGHGVDSLLLEDFSSVTGLEWRGSDGVVGRFIPGVEIAKAAGEEYGVSFAHGRPI